MSPTRQDQRSGGCPGSFEDAPSLVAHPVHEQKGLDRVFENVSGDFGWSRDRSRNISVDIRYVLWIMESVYPAPRLLEEMGLAK